MWVNHWLVGTRSNSFLFQCLLTPMAPCANLKKIGTIFTLFLTLTSPKVCDTSHFIGSVRIDLKLSDF